MDNLYLLWQNIHQINWWISITYKYNKILIIKGTVHISDLDGKICSYLLLFHGRSVVIPLSSLLKSLGEIGSVTQHWSLLKYIDLLFVIEVNSSNTMDSWNKVNKMLQPFPMFNWYFLVNICGKINFHGTFIFSWSGQQIAKVEIFIVELLYNRDAVGLS